MAATLADRLGVRPEDRLLVLHAPERYPRLLEPPPGVRIDPVPAAGAVYDAVHLFALDRATVDREVRPLLASLPAAVTVWVFHPRPGGTIITDLRSNRGWDALADDGWHPIAREPVDTDWAALRFTRR